MKDSDGHNYTFSIPEMPWKKKWNNEQLDLVAEAYKAFHKTVVIHCKDWEDEIRVRKYMEINHPVVDFEVIIDEH